MSHGCLLMSSMENFMSLGELGWSHVFQVAQRHELECHRSRNLFPWSLSWCFLKSSPRWWRNGVACPDCTCLLPCHHMAPLRQLLGHRSLGLTLLFQEAARSALNGPDKSITSFTLPSASLRKLGFPVSLDNVKLLQYIMSDSICLNIFFASSSYSGHPPLSC